MRVPGRSVRRSPLKLTAVVASLAALAFCVSTSGTLAGWTTATVTNGTDNASIGQVVYNNVYQSTASCGAGPRVAAKSCAGSIAPTAPAPGSATTDTITDTGTVRASELTEQAGAAACGVVQLSNLKDTSHPLLPRYGTTFQTTDKWGTTRAVKLDGTAAFAADPTSTSNASLLGGSSSIGVWFYAASSSHGGGLISLSASPVTGTSAPASPTVWMDSTGKIHYYLSGTLGTSTVGATAGAYNNGAWHLLTLSIDAGGLLGLTMTPTVYIDGVSVTSGGGLGLLTGGTAYWHLGWADFTNISNSPAVPYFDGSLSGAYVLNGTAQTRANNASLFATTSAAAYATALSGATDLWMLGDDGKVGGTTAGYTGSHPYFSAPSTSASISPCTMVDMTWTLTDPTGSPVSAATRLSALSGSLPSATFGAPAIGASPGQTSTIMTSKDSTYNGYIAGLHLYAPLSLIVNTIPSSNWKLTFTWDGAESAFLG